MRRTEPLPPLSGTAYAFISTDSTALARYEELCRQAGDTTYNRKLNDGCGSFLFDNRCYPVNGWEHIDLTCDKDYDAEHPAGSSLSDIVQFGSISPKRHIESGYNDWCNESCRDPEKISSYFFSGFWDGFPVDGRLNEGPYRGTNLLGMNNYNPVHFVLNIVKNPAWPGKHCFTLTCTDTQGNTFTAAKTVMFPIE